MTFPWKKVKKASLSKLVKEHYHSQNGSPLLVETGFPTSLVDLVVKNRSRFKKPCISNKKKKPSSPIDPLPTPPPINSPIINSRIDSPLIPESEGEGEREGEKTDLGKSVKMKKSSQFEEGWGNGGVSMNQGFVAVFKMVMVVCLVLGMNNLVIGITVSAFLLFLLEYLGERLYGLVKPFCKMVQGIWEMFRAKVVKLEEGEDDDDCVFKAPLLYQEIEEIGPCVEERSRFVEEKFNCDGELECDGVDIDGVVMEKGGDFRCELLESKEKKSHRAKMKAKMKKLVPKKFRKKKGSVLESHTILNEVDDVIEGSSELKLKSDGMVSSVAIRVDDITSVGESSKELTTGGSVEESFEGIDKATTIGEDGLTEREHNSMYMVLLFVVLVGLIGGRILALVFTIACCLMSKRGEGIRRYAKLPVIRSFAKISS